MKEPDRDTDFIARWSQRKQAARRGETLPAEAPLSAESLGAVSEGPTAQVACPDPDPDPVSEQVLTDADMPPLDSLGAFSDYSGFLSRGVSATLRRQALAKLFHSPHLNVTDRLDDFGEDYSRYESLGALITADMRHQLEVAARRLAEQTKEDGAAAPERTAAPRPRDPEGALEVTAPALAALADPDRADQAASPTPGDLS
jgi:hypothetical protein